RSCGGRDGKIRGDARGGNRCLRRDRTRQAHRRAITGSPRGVAARARDQAAVDKVLSKLATEYPQIMPRLLALDSSVPEAARESSLRLAGQRIGRWVFEQEHAQAGKLDLDHALEQIGAPALRALVDIDQDGSQLHIRNSPLCTEDGHSGCTFFSGYL